MPVIYAITHIETGRQYIGSALRFAARRRSHFWHLKADKHRNPILQRAWNKYGPDAFDFSVIEEVADPNQLRIREQHYLDTMRPHFNIALAADSPMRGRKQSATFIAMLRARVGVTRSPEVRAQIAATLRGRKVGPRTEEVKRKLSEQLMGHTVSGETRARIGAKSKGRRHTAEAKARIGAYSREHGIRPDPQRGEDHPRALLTWVAVREIRAKYATGRWTLAGLGAEYGVDHSTIGYIVRHKIWRDDPDETPMVLDPAAAPLVPRIRRYRART